MKPLKIFIDIDGVLADFQSGYLKIGGVPTKEGSFQHSKEADDYVLNPNSLFWFRLEPLRSFDGDALNALRRLSIYHHVTFITNRHWPGADYKDVFRQTLQWLKKYFYFDINLIVLPLDVPKAFPICNLSSPDFEQSVLIDDSPRQVEAARDSGLQVFLFPHDSKSLYDFANHFLPYSFVE